MDVLQDQYTARLRLRRPTFKRAAHAPLPVDWSSSHPDLLYLPGTEPQAVATATGPGSAYNLVSAWLTSRWSGPKAFIQSMPRGTDGLPSIAQLATYTYNSHATSVVARDGAAAFMEERMEPICAAQNKKYSAAIGACEDI